MDLLTFLRAVLALGVTLGLVGLAAYAARRWGLTGLAGLAGARLPAERRLQVLESLALDPQRRLVLVRVDAEERLLLLGEGRAVDVEARRRA